MLLSTVIQTQRLVLRNESVDDARAIHAMNCDAEVMRYIGDGKPWAMPLEEYAQRQRAALEKIASEARGYASVYLRDSGQFIGLCWLMPDQLLKEDLELGYRYVRSAWGQGYATEAGREVVRVGLETLGLRRIVACTHPENHASRRVLQKLGFEHVRDIYHPRVDREVPFFVVERAGCY